jgi:hypothetical protein
MTTMVEGEKTMMTTMVPVCQIPPPSVTARVTMVTKVHGEVTRMVGVKGTVMRRMGGTGMVTTQMGGIEMVRWKTVWLLVTRDDLS